MKRVIVVAGLTCAIHPVATAQSPQGLAARAVGDARFDWQRDSVAGIRAYFLPGSYAIRHQDSLTHSLSQALSHAAEMIGAPQMTAPIDVFFLESREQMRELTGASATGFAHSAARAVFLVTNPQWRAFERHEIMHVVAVNAWGAIGQSNAWLQEGLGQAADGRCAEFSNTEVAIALAQRHGWIDLPTMLHRFREQSDLRAYLQAASFVSHLLRHAGAGRVRPLWTADADSTSQVAGKPLTAWYPEWRAALPSTTPVSSARLDAIEAAGCGIPGPRS
jgi:hypothetical protein